MANGEHLTLPLGEAIYTLRAIRRFLPDPISDTDLATILEAATRAPSGGNVQPWHFIVIRDEDKKQQFGPLYREAWWAKRKDSGIDGPSDIPESNKTYRSAMHLADTIAEAPVIVLVCAIAHGPGPMASVIPATQNLLLAARALGIGGTITTLHRSVDDRVHALFGIPESVQIVYAIPLGYPRGNFGPTRRKDLELVVSQDYWGEVPGWA